MAQHDYVIANGTGAAVRSDLNNALAAIVSQNSGATAPATTYAFQFWADTTTGLLKLRNSANSAWVTLFQLDGEWSTLPVENGTAAAPSIYFKDSGTDTGFYSPGTDQVAISTGGTGRLFINSSGSVGIGSSSPAYQLVVEGSSPWLQLKQSATNTGSCRLLFADGDSAFAGQIIYDHGNNSLSATTNGTTAITIDSSQRVGIGTTSPASIFHVSGSADQTYTFQTTTAGADNRINFRNSAGTDAGGIWYMHSGNHLLFNTGGSNGEKARIDGSGRLLVGTSSSSADAIAVFLGRSSAPGGTGGEIKLAHPTTNVPASATLGRIHFGNTTDDRGAEIAAIANQTWTSTAKGSYLTFSTTADGASSPTERMRISSDGQLRTLAAQTAFLLSSASSAGTSEALIEGKYSASSTGGGTTSFIVYTNGNVRNTNNSYGAISDVKLKENIVDAGSQWDDLKALQVRKYNFKEGQTHTQIGLVAQEVELVSPGLVSESPDRDAEGNNLGTVTKSVNYSVLYMKAVKALQEAMERIEQLEAKVAALESA